MVHNGATAMQEFYSCTRLYFVRGGQYQWHMLCNLFVNSLSLTFAQSQPLRVWHFIYIIFICVSPGFTRAQSAGRKKRKYWKAGTTNEQNTRWRLCKRLHLNSEIFSSITRRLDQKKAWYELHFTSESFNRCIFINTGFYRA